MTDLFQDKAQDWDSRPVPQQISEGVGHAMRAAIAFTPDAHVLDFGAGTGLVASQIAPLVGGVVALDVSPAMLAQLASKPELHGKVETVCQDILERPLGRSFDVIVSAMAAHHVRDTGALLAALYAHLRPGGRLALADLDAEDGTFHPAEAEGVFHAGFDRMAFAALARDAGFADAAFTTTCDVERDGRSYPVFLFVATRPS